MSVRAYSDVREYECVWVHLHVCQRVCICVYVCVYVCVYMCVCVCVCVCVRAQGVVEVSWTNPVSARDVLVLYCDDSPSSGMCDAGDVTRVVKVCACGFVGLGSVRCECAWLCLCE